MAHYLRKFERKFGTYLVIYESHLDKNKGRVVNNHVKVLGYVDDLKQQGIEDPIAYAKKEVETLNKKRKQALIEENMKKIEKYPVKNFGYFFIDVLLNKLALDTDINWLNYTTQLPIELSDLLRDLIYARIVKPSSKKQTFEEVLPSLLYPAYTGNLDNLYKGLDLLGQNYSRVIEIFNHHINKLFSRDTSSVYCDCTNFYFEIDKEDELRRKGPSKENKQDPIVSMALLLDRDKIPISMKIFPGNQSEKPIIRQTINEMKSSCNITGKTVQVADKGINCSQNILEAVKNGDGYIFSQSVKQLNQLELAWLFNPHDYKVVLDPETKKVTYKQKSCIDTYAYNYIDPNGKTHVIELKQKRLITWNAALCEKQRMEILKMVEKVDTFSCYQAKRKELGDMAKYLKLDSDSTISLHLNNEKIVKDLKLAGYNMIITSEINMGDKELYDTYHELWRIEESFRIMKSELDARPVYVQQKNKICGHFLICYLAVTLLRILQFKYFKTLSSQQIIKLIRSMLCAKNGNKIINLTNDSTEIQLISQQLKIPLINYYFSEATLKKLFKNVKYGKK